MNGNNILRPTDAVSDASRPLLHKKDRLFQEKVAQLREYGEKHGHIAVSRKDNPTLHNWIRNLRSDVSEFIEKRAKKFPLELAQKKILDDMKFDWSINNLSRTTKSFRFILNNIDQFREINGHVDVFREDVSEPNVEMFRKAMTHLKSKKDSLSKGRKKQLKSMGILLEEIHPSNESFSGDAACTQPRIEETNASVYTSVSYSNSDDSSHDIEGLQSLHSEQQKMMPRRSTRRRNNKKRHFQD